MNTGDREANEPIACARGDVLYDRFGMFPTPCFLIEWLRRTAKQVVHPASSATRIKLVGLVGVFLILAASWLNRPNAPCLGMTTKARVHMRTDFERMQNDYFRQTQQCGSWHSNYSKTHSEIVAGKRPPRYFVSMSVRSGVGDRLTGMITQLYLAILSDRALTEVTYGNLASFNAACTSNFINLTHPEILPEHLLTPLKHDYRGDHAYDARFVNTSHYVALYTVNKTPSSWQNGNLSSLPEQNHGIPYVIGTSNRGRTFVIANNAYHKSHFWNMGIRPETAFMCGAFFLCMPNAAVQRMYQRYWDILRDATALKIGINVRIGEHVYSGEVEYNATVGRATIDSASGYFDCATKLEEEFALPGQKVIWLIISDSLLLRQAAVATYGSKVLTDLERKPVHTDCQRFSPSECTKEAVDLAMVHSIGQMYTFSMADYHILPGSRGFGRLGAWLSGRWNNLYELQDAKSSCDPREPTTQSASSRHMAGV
jgi:hypothetical protein